ncbi:MAG: lysine--tRNA ligase [Euryarchaeota archaeon]|nr:lysine--tRNA ligase [Euryarchaeota archaeon]OUW22960.1 MAG: lysine--tRNA ligase [Euryarchaeota archaeon TMED173]
MHWAEYTAQRLKERGGDQVSASGITPSGEFHIGHLREILSAEMIHRACLDAGMESKYIFIVDSMDPLRRVYDFLSPEYEEYIGCPLAFIPAPDSDGKPSDSSISYAEYFLNPFLEALEQIGVNPEVVMNHESYERGEFAEYIDLAIKNKEEIRITIQEISGRELPKEWFPYSPIGSDGSLDGVKVTGYENPYVFWTDAHGVDGKSDIRNGEGKMPWRIDWAARWIIHGITCEPAGKDHGAAGGSYDTGIPICKILGGEPPDKIVYEWIQLKGMGPMSSSSGVTIGPMEALSLVPPEILRYIIARSKINRHIEFDTGISLFQTADEYERLVSASSPDLEGMNKRQLVAHQTQAGAIRFSQVKTDSDPRESIGGVTFRHLSMLAQIKSSDDDVWSSLNRSGHIKGKPGSVLKIRLSRMRAWINGPHFPEESRIDIRSEISDETKTIIGGLGVLFLTSLSSLLSDCEWSEEEISAAISQACDNTGIQRKDGYSSVYLAMIGRAHGPKASALLFEMERSAVISLFDCRE